MLLAIVMGGKVYFNFLQIALRIKEKPSITVTDSDWSCFFDFCKKQALLGIGFAAVEKLHRQGIECPKPLMMRWMTAVLQIERCNEILNEQCRSLTKQYEHDGLRCCILKGQGNLLNYPDKLSKRRTPGDIDVWTISGDGGMSIAIQTRKDVVEYVNYKGRKGVIEYVKMQHRLIGTTKEIELRYHHIEALKIGDTPVEVHFRVGFVHSPLRNWRMQRWFDTHTDECMKNKSSMGFAVPTTSMNVVYQMTHLFSHSFDEGLGLRQLLDYYYVLRVWHNDCMERHTLQSHGMWMEGLGNSFMSPEEIMKVFGSFGMAKFAAAVMWVLQRVFDMPVEWLLCPPDERRGKQLLDEIMAGGNFGQYDIRGAEMKDGGTIKHGIWKLKRVMRLMRNYPEEALCEPLFRVWHIGWRCFH